MSDNKNKLEWTETRSTVVFETPAPDYRWTLTVKSLESRYDRSAFRWSLICPPEPEPVAGGWALLESAAVADAQREIDARTQSQ